MNVSPENGPTTGTSMNGHGAADQNLGDRVDVHVDTNEIVGIIVLGLMFLLVLFSLLRSQRRERQLLERMIELQAAQK